MNYESQGMGVLPSHLVIAEEYLRQNKKPIDDVSIKKTVMKLAREKAESYTPSDELGRNPESRISPALKKDMAPWLYGPNSIMKHSGLSASEKQATMIELNGAINHLTQILLKRFYGFKISRKPNVKNTDPRVLTDFEYVASGPGGLEKDERIRYNTAVDVNRQIRGMVQAYITGAIIPIIADDKENIYKRFQKMYAGTNPKLIRSNAVYKNLMKHLGSRFLITFGTTKISDYMKNFRITPKGGFLGGKRP